MPATSKAQQRLMGIAYAVKMGYMKLTDVAPEYIDKVKELSNSMTTQQLKDFASTDTKDLTNTIIP